MSSVGAMAKREQIYTVKETAEILRVEPITIRRMIARGEIEAFPVGDEYRITQSALDEVIRRRKSKKREK